MGSMTDANIEAFQEATGIKPARGEYADKLDELATAAFELIKVLQDERSGIRDGNGFWHGSDPPDSLVRQIGEVWEAAQASRPRAGEIESDNRANRKKKVADDPKTGELPSPESDSDEDGNGVGKRNKLEHYASRPLTDFLQFDGFLDCHPDDDVMRPDSDGHALMGGKTEELMYGAHVRVLVKPKTPAKDASSMLRKIADWIDRGGMDACRWEADPETGELHEADEAA